MSGQEAEVLGWIRGQRPSTFEVADDADTVLLWVPEIRRPGAPFVVLAGHVDTVPVTGDLEAGIAGSAVRGRGASDMKGSLAVMLEVADSLASGGVRSGVDVGFLFFGREELPITQSALLPLFERAPWARAIDLAIVMEPTDNRLQMGCLGNLNATVTATGRSAHSARPWLGENAVHTLVQALAPLTELPVRDVEIDGLRFREVVSVTMIDGGIAGNVIPDRASARVNLRYAPTHGPDEAEARLRELLGSHAVEVTVEGNAPPGRLSVDNPLVERLRVAGDLVVESKQAWTPVAEFASAGVDAVNFGPGAPQYAHTDDERVEVAALERAYDVLTIFLREDASGGTG